MLSELSYFAECSKMPRKKRHQIPNLEVKKTDESDESPHVVTDKYVLAWLYGMPYCVWPVEVVGVGVFCRCDNMK